jgi:hypothetical protein
MQYHDIEDQIISNEEECWLLSKEQGNHRTNGKVQGLASLRVVEIYRYYWKHLSEGYRICQVNKKRNLSAS